MSCTAGPQVSPPSADRETSIALAEPGANEPPVVESDIAHAVPSGPIETHGSVARSKSPPLAALPPPQRENAKGRVAQVAPPSKETAATSPRADPLDHRSCCHMATRWPGLEGFAARLGSTSAFT